MGSHSLIPALISKSFVKTNSASIDTGYNIRKLFPLAAPCRSTIVDEDVELAFDLFECVA